ncbi:Y4yA family PLP-dependent enzyme [Streptomyces fumanus]|uniref:Diaminopimelate decarboxylase n=1 Tax=Streptomyces fumanus TaxID=67302 RepID=A0A919E6R3_9ACTN|nr:Y4yA family PLP-dependent enzyme [Streptomyces fumanus]GHF19505.1 diaminopimelate decarboxylase [Streptomyces fumanus]
MRVPLYLRPRLEPPLDALLDTPHLLHTLVDALGSPLNVLLPDRVAENAERFLAVYRKHHLAGRVTFAHKANGANSLLRRLAAADPAAVGVDVASLGELQHALASGFTPDRITATGPKDPAFLWLAARTGVTVHPDSITELGQLADLVRRFALPRVAVLPRLSGFDAATGAGATGVRVRSRRSRFGTPLTEAEALLDALDRHRDAVEPVGVAYHLDTTGLAEKAVALEQCVGFLDALRARGRDPRVLDIGGGFGVGYVDDAAQWDRYTTELGNAVLGTRPALTWRGHGYGLRNEGGTLRGALALYPAHRPDAGPGYLDELLTTPAPATGRPPATLLLEHLYDLSTQPGRALVDQCGAVLARVLDVTPSDSGDLLVRLAMNAGDMSLEEHGVLVDPVLLPRPGDSPPADSPSGDTTPADSPPDAGPVGVHLFGNLCLEADLITRRTVFLPRRPRPGDLLAFANTAGYAMDFHAHRAQRQPVARTVAVVRDGGSWRWCLDEEYWPTTHPGGTA